MTLAFLAASLFFWVLVIIASWKPTALWLARATMTGWLWKTIANSWKQISEHFINNCAVIWFCPPMCRTSRYRQINTASRYKAKIGQLVFHLFFFFSGLNSVACNRNKTWLVPGPACTKRKTNYCWSSLRDIVSLIRDPARKRWIYWLTKHFYRCSLKSTHDLQTLLQRWIVPLALVQLKFAKSLKIKLIVSVSYYFGVLSFVGVPSIYFSYLSENVQTRNL